MLSIRVLALGKIKEPYLKEGLAEYTKRLGTMIRLQTVELPDEKLPERLSKAELAQVKELEGRRITRALRTGEYVIALDRTGKEFSSEQFADELSMLALSGRSNLVFIIGASCGLSEEVLHRADLCLSFGMFTFPHQLMRLILLEQIYRACKISRGETYHK